MKQAIKNRMIAKMNNCHSIGIICSYRTVLEIEYCSAIERGKLSIAHIILELIGEEIAS